MSFSPAVKEEALVKSRRCCCICYEFAGLYTNVHHILQEADGGANDLDNAIVLCLRCHGEVGHYNPRHPIGNKYSENELKAHRDQWWAWCKSFPGVPLPKNPVAISPGKLFLGTQEWKARSIVTIYNKSDDFWYQIFIKITSSSDIITTDHIDIRPPKFRAESEIDEAVRGLSIQSQLFRLDGIDSIGKWATYLWLESLDPKENLKLVITNRLAKRLPKDHKPEAYFSICGFSSEPANILIQPSERLAIPFKLPENFILKNTALLVKRMPS